MKSHWLNGESEIVSDSDNGYCVGNAVDYAKKNDVLAKILSTELRGQ